MSYSLQTFKLIILVSNISYFVGIFWLFYCRLFIEIHDPINVFGSPVDIFGNPYGYDNFIEHFEI